MNRLILGKDVQLGNMEAFRENRHIAKPIIQNYLLNKKEYFENNCQPLTLRAISKFSDPQIFMPTSNAPISKKNSRSTAIAQPIIVGVRTGAVLSFFIRNNSRCGTPFLHKIVKSFSFLNYAMLFNSFSPTEY